MLAGGLMGLINEPAGVHCMRYGRGSLALAAAAQQRGKVFRISIISRGTRATLRGSPPRRVAVG